MKNTLILKSFLCCTFLSCLPLLAAGDEITLTNGTKLEGVIIAQDPKSMLMETRYGSMTLTLKSIKEVKQASKEDNLLLRGDFFREKGKYDDAMKYYQEALLANPKSQKVRDKYDDLNHKLESLKKSQAMAVAKKVEPQSVTHENVEDAKTAKDLKKDEMLSLQATGEAMYPLYSPKGEDKEKITIQNAKLNALSKIFTDSMGYGFEAKGNKAKILPPGELPNVNIKVLKQDKLSTGYRVQIQVLGPTNSVMVKVPDNYPLTEAQGVTPDIRAKSQTLLRQRALETTMLSAVEIAVNKELEAKPKNKNKKVFGRVFPVAITQEALTPQGYFLRGNFKVWIDPAYETVK